ncbi:MAG: hypothetical protein HYV20_11020 [Gemmatimonadetes bacterium]|nr:hypothetical protein [Gemmatimonadota bacterium]
MMTRRLAALPLVLLACGGNPENTASCGFASIAAASMVMQSMQDLSHAVATAPASVPGELPAKVVGRGTVRTTVTSGPQGLTLRYEGEGFPTIPGFGLLLVDDSLEVVRGVLIYEPEAPPGYAKLGTIATAATTLPLIGLRVHWPSLNAPRCPMFQPLAGDSAGS